MPLPVHIEPPEPVDELLLLPPLPEEVVELEVLLVVSSPPVELWSPPAPPAPELLPEVAVEPALRVSNSDEHAIRALILIRMR
jgi:hypothetical protein